jgi:hypothetical protein
VVSTPLKILVNSQQEGLSHILWKIKNETTNQFFAIENSWLMKIDIFSHEE